MFIKSVFRANLGKISSFCGKILEGGNRYKSIAQKFLAVGVSFSLAAAMVPLGQSRFVAEAAEITEVTRTSIALTPDSSTIDDTGADKSKWKSTTVAGERWRDGLRIEQRGRQRNCEHNDG